MARDIDRRNFLKAAGGAAVTTSMTAGCLSGILGEGDNDGGEGGTLTYGRGAPSDTLDPQSSTSGEVAKVTNQVYEPLIGFEPGTATLAESLATNWEMDGTTATIELREGAEFHNGDEFTAEDFIATYRRYLDEDYDYYNEDGSIYGPYLLGSVEDVTAEDDYTLTFEISKRYAPFMANLAVFALVVLPKSEIEAETDFATEMVGTGPFELDNLNEGSGQVRLTANDNYWGDGPNVDEVVFQVIGENSTRASSLNAGELDIIDGLDSQTVGQVEEGDGEVRRIAGMNVGYLAMNGAEFEPFQDKRVRQAMNYAIDTEALANNIYQGIATPASQPITESILGYNEDLDPYPHDPDQAQSLLEEAGYGDGFDLEIAAFQNPRAYNPSPTQAAETISSYLEDIGINVTIEQQTWESYLEYTGTGKHDACFLGWMTDNGDPDNFYYALLHPQIDVPEDQDFADWDADGYNTSNRAAWANNEFMELIEEGQTTYDDGEREELYQQAGEIFHEECPWVPLVHTEEIRGVSSDINNYVVELIGGPFLAQVQLN
ncbi:ABC transporter substrate-binding protein [Halostella sp. PRR32]|uniref:ABC transporter substrate-binding protein n=1 Tax=Halostella sp. PRR32 TaxID=3098147 RepID=UPI002B1D0C2C|nr:ABC transporter substrate-binding protein [Halostella sp. PRR32]